MKGEKSQSKFISDETVKKDYVLSDSLLSDYSKSDLWYKKGSFDVITTVRRKLIVIVSLCCTFIVIESFGAYFSNSIAILTDVIHLLSDLLGFAVSLLTVEMTKKRANQKFSYGYLRSEILGALVSVLIIWLMSIWIFTKSYARFIKIINHEHIEIDSFYMIVTSFFGLLINIIMALTLNGNFSCLESSVEEDEFDEENNQKNNTDQLYNNSNIIKQLREENELNEEEERLIKDKQINLTNPDPNDNQNIKAALAHILGDMVQSIGVVSASTILYLKPDWLIIDPLLSVSFMIISFSFSIPVIRDIIDLLMDTTPKEINVEEFQEEIMRIKFVTEIHDLHIWNVTFGKPNMTCHIKATEKSEYILKKVTLLARKYGIYHSTVQIELENRFRINCDQNIHEQLIYQN